MPSLFERLKQFWRNIMDIEPEDDDEDDKYYEETTESKPRAIHTVKDEQAIARTSRPVKMRTKNIYPKKHDEQQMEEFFERQRPRQFRFPVVSDKEWEKKERMQDIRSAIQSDQQLRNLSRTMKEKEPINRPSFSQMELYENSSNEIKREKRRETEISKRNTEDRFPQQSTQVDYSDSYNKPVAPKQASSTANSSSQDSTPQYFNPKKPFKPTEIFSPIYGKITEETKAEQEKKVRQAYVNEDGQIVVVAKEINNAHLANDSSQMDGSLSEGDLTDEQQSSMNKLPMDMKELLQQSIPLKERLAHREVTRVANKTANEETPSIETARIMEQEPIESEQKVAEENIERIGINEEATVITSMNEVAATMEVLAAEDKMPEVEAVQEKDAPNSVADQQVVTDIASDIPEEPLVEETSAVHRSNQHITPEDTAHVVSQDNQLLSDSQEMEPSNHVTAVEQQSEPQVLTDNRVTQVTGIHVESASTATYRNISDVTLPPQKVNSEEITDAPYQFPSLELLTPTERMTEDVYEHTLEQKGLLEETLSNFNVSATVVNIVKGPSVTRFELQPSPGVKVNKITGLSDDIKLNLAAKDIRIEAPIPGRNAVGIEVPNIKSEPVFIRRILESQKFQQHPSPLAVALGMDIGGEPIIADLKKMPHGLVAGATGSGKSVCINSIIVSILFKATPEQVRLLLIDPKMVELAPYNNLPHLVTPVVTDAKQATASLKWAVEEMEKRYTLFVEAGVRDIERYNQTTDDTLPYIVIIIDELADLMMVSPQDVEDCIIRIAQKARACGIHLLLATQRPSVDIITGNIKANVPTRLAFAVFSHTDSRTILDQGGAERLLGRGDMLFLESGAPPIRLQGNYVNDDEIEAVTAMLKKQRQPDFLFTREELEAQVTSGEMGDDPLFHEALVYVAEQGNASASSLQRRFRIGYNRAARLIEMMEASGYVSGQNGGKPRTVLITPEDAQALTEGTALF
ncbi:DNA translocase FtsK [Brevibacillus daliensis]|uniref:DNA translocase FtsK n=1 Tax=Brevibacillus daliensis TaxID=2892995 RepID=UPI001E50D078|nr:DNA translocase FtsK [Brevibacillus daliensis]